MIPDIQNSQGDYRSGVCLSTDSLGAAAPPVFIFLTLLHSERPKLYAILAFLSAIGLRNFQDVVIPSYLDFIEIIIRGFSLRIRSTICKSVIKFADQSPSVSIYFD